MQQGMTYSVTVGSATNASPTTGSVTFDIYNTRSEAVHVNLVGYVAAADHKAADLYSVARQRRRPRLLLVRGQHGLPLQRGHRPGHPGRHGDLLEAERLRRLLLQPDALRRLERRLPGVHQPRHLPPCRPGRRLQPGLHDRERRLRESLPGFAARLLLHADRAGQPDRHLSAPAHAALHPGHEPREHRRLSHDRHPVRSGLGPDPQRPVGPPRRLGAVSQARQPDEPQRVRRPLGRRRLGPPPRPRVDHLRHAAALRPHGRRAERRRRRHPRERQRHPRPDRRGALRGRLLAASSGRQRLLARPHEPERQQPAVPGGPDGDRRVGERRERGHAGRGLSHRRPDDAHEHLPRRRDRRLHPREQPRRPAARRHAGRRLHDRPRARPQDDRRRLPVQRHRKHRLRGRGQRRERVPNGDRGARERHPQPDLGDGGLSLHAAHRALPDAAGQHAGLRHRRGARQGSGPHPEPRPRAARRTTARATSARARTCSAR